MKPLYILWTGLSVVALFRPGIDSIQAETVRVAEKNGRVQTGELDERTNGSHLWLRFEGAATRLLRPIPWSSIKTVEKMEDRLDVGAQQSGDLSNPPELPETALNSDTLAPEVETSTKLPSNAERAQFILGLDP